MSEWKIHRRESGCGACAKVFEEGEALFSVLHLSEEALRREDLCTGCFQDPGEAAPAGSLFWRTHHRTDPRARFAVDFEALSELFLALDARREERLLELRYVVALLLLRKKRLKLVGVRRRPDGEVLNVRRPRHQEEFEVRVYDLDGERAQAIQADLARVFEGAGLETLSTEPAASEEVPEDLPASAG
jgi:hypothetical protein